ncbi:hypothetical protein BGX28_008395 [Mortierella sp. GBA30]|nr:hypothetical protein BGX28_008395 [Mortierella sp. GBA30]
MPPDPATAPPPPRPISSLPSSSSSSSASTVSSRRLRRLLLSFSVLFLASPPALRRTEAVTCLYPNYSTAAQPGQLFDVAWQLTNFDSVVYDTVSAELYCMDMGGSYANQWRSVSTIFSNKTINSTMGQYQFKLPNCGPLAGNGAIRLETRGLGGTIRDEDSCYFSIIRTFSLVPEPPVDSPISTAPVAPPTTSDPPAATRQPRIMDPQPTAAPSSVNAKIPPPVATTNAENPTPAIGSVTTTTPAVQPIASQSTSPNPTVSGPDSGGRVIGTSASQPSPKPTLPPPPNLPAGATGSPQEDPTKNEKLKKITAVLGSLGSAACLALVVLSLLVIKKRRRERRRNAINDQKSLPRSRGPDTRTGGLGGSGVGGAMKETQRRLRLKRNPKDGYFFQMDDHDHDELDIESHGNSSDRPIDEKSRAPSGTDTALATALATASHQTIPTMQEDFFFSAMEQRQPIMAALPPPLTPLQPARLEPLSTTETNRQRQSPMLYTDSASGSYSMSSYQSSFETSSVVRKYWAASMAARAERQAEGHPPSTREIEHHRRQSGYSYEEGSVFGDGDGSSRDSDSRLADILSMRTTASGESAATTRASRRHYRRNTLNSFGASSFGQTETMTLSLSSIPDSLMISEDEFLERLRAHQLEQEYYAQQQHQLRHQDVYSDDDRYQPHDHYRPEHPYYHHGSIISRRMSSVPSLTSSTDPFKTFDSNEVLLDMDHSSEDPMDPFSDYRALSRTSSRRSMYDHGYHLYITQEGIEDEPKKTRPPIVQALPTYPSASALSF